MSPDRVTVTIDGEWLLTKLQQIEEILDKIRVSCGDGVFVRPPTGDVTIDYIDWKAKDSAPAKPEDEWAWAFAYDRAGNYKDESEALVKQLEATGKVEVDGYTITLSGKDKNLLSRKLPKQRKQEA